MRLVFLDPQESHCVAHREPAKKLLGKLRCQDFWRLLVLGKAPGEICKGWASCHMLGGGTEIIKFTNGLQGNRSNGPEPF